MSGFEPMVLVGPASTIAIAALRETWSIVTANQGKIPLVERVYNEALEAYRYSEIVHSRMQDSWFQAVVNADGDPEDVLLRQRYKFTVSNQMEAYWTCFTALIALHERLRQAGFIKTNWILPKAQRELDRLLARMRIVLDSANEHIDALNRTRDLLKYGAYTIHLGNERVQRRDARMQRGDEEVQLSAAQWHNSNENDNDEDIDSEEEYEEKHIAEGRRVYRPIRHAYRTRQVIYRQSLSNTIQDCEAVLARQDLPDPERRIFTQSYRDSHAILAALQDEEDLVSNYDEATRLGDLDLGVQVATEQFRRVGFDSTVNIRTYVIDPIIEQEGSFYGPPDSPHAFRHPRMRFPNREAGILFRHHITRYTSQESLKLHTWVADLRQYEVEAPAIRMSRQQILSTFRDYAEDHDWRALYDAISHGNLAGVQDALRGSRSKINAVPFAVDHQGRTPLALAIGFVQWQTGYTHIVECLLRRGAKINTDCGTGDSALDHAIYEGWLETASIIVQEIALRRVSLLWDGRKLRNPFVILLCLRRKLLRTRRANNL